MDPEIHRFLAEMLLQTNPAMVAMVIPSGAGAKFLTDWAKRQFCLQGNVVQTVAGGIACAVTAFNGLMAGVFKGGLTSQEATGLTLVAVLTWFAAIAVDQVGKDKNPSPETVEARDLEADAKEAVSELRRKAEGQETP